MKKADKEHYGKIANLGCALCHFVLGYPETPCELHHIRRTMPRKSAPVIGLCREHHRGDTGIHGLGRKAFEAKYGITEEWLLDKVLENV